TVWTARVEQRSFFWISATWFACFAVLALWRGWRSLSLPPVKLSAILIAGGLLVAGSVLAIAYRLGTLHQLFGIKNPLQHAGMYILWAIIQQWIQQQFFMHRFEHVTRSGV